MAEKITKRSEDYAQWYLDVINQAALAENSDVRGCMVIKPNGYSLWEKMQGALDRMFKNTGHVNAYFPLFIPKSFLAREEEMATVVQDFFKIKIDLCLNDMKPEEKLKNPEHYFMHGVLDGKKGTCLPVSVLYAAVGRRLRYPLKLVTTTEHMFVRWEGPKRFNIESAIEGFDTQPDSYYLEWPKKQTEKDASRYGFLKSMTPAQEVSNFLLHRGLCLAIDPQTVPEGVKTILWAHGLTPDNPNPIATAMQLMHPWRVGLMVNTPVWFPQVRFKFSNNRRFKHLPRKIEQEFMRLDIMTKLMREHFDGAGAVDGEKLAELPDVINVNCE